jgi:hypothetical protein
MKVTAESHSRACLTIAKVSGAASHSPCGEICQAHKFVIFYGRMTFAESIDDHCEGGMRL